MLKSHALTATILAVSFGLAAAPRQPAQARLQSSPSPLSWSVGLEAQTEEVPTVGSFPIPQQFASWGKIWDTLRRKKGEGGSRGDSEDPCMISPVRLGNRNPGDPKDPPQRFVIWDNRPLFLWKASSTGDLPITKLEVRQARIDTLIWSKTLPTPEKGELRSLIYEGEPLQRGVTYHWGAPSPRRWNEGLEVPVRIHFTVMEQAEYDQVAQELAAMEQAAIAQGKSVVEIQEQRVDFFVERRLWADAFREVYASSKGDSEAIADLRRKIEAENFCPPPNFGSTARNSRR